MYCTVVAGSSNSATRTFWKQLFGDVRVTRQEVQKIREEQKKNTALLEKLQQNTHSLAQQMRELQEKNFSVQGSEYQVGYHISPFPMMC